VVLVAGRFTSVLGASIFDIVIPGMRYVFGLTTDDIERSATSYTLVLGVVVPAGSWLGNRFGMKPAR